MDRSNCHQPSIDANASVRITMCTLEGRRACILKSCVVFLSAASEGSLSALFWVAFSASYTWRVFHVNFSDCRVELWSWVLMVTFFLPMHTFVILRWSIMILSSNMNSKNNSELFFIFSCHLLPIDRVNIFRTQNLIQWDVLPHSVDESSPIVLAVADIWPDPIE